jgi:hypothetical protein
MRSWNLHPAWILISMVCLAHATEATLQAEQIIHVDGTKGDDKNSGDAQKPLKSLSAVIAKLKDPLTESVLIELASGTYSETGSVGMPSNCLHLMCRMRPGVRVRISGKKDEAGQVPVLDWKGEPLIDATEGTWWIENVQMGSFLTTQRQGVAVSKTAHVTLKNVVFRTRSHSGGTIHASRGGKVSLRGSIKINEHLHEKIEKETFAGIVAEDHGLVMFEESQGASLDMGNGSLSASYYGVIRLGCETAKITSWGEQSNNLAINNGGRIDLHSSVVTLRARNRLNTPIGLEHDGHILAEGAKVIIEGENGHAIVLQKASSFTCNSVELRGKFRTVLEAMSGSIFVGQFKSDVGSLSATTSASIHVGQIDGKVLGTVLATKGGVVSLPDRTVSSK